MWLQIFFNDKYFLIYGNASCDSQNSHFVTSRSRHNMGLWMVISIRMCIICLMPSMWKVRSNKMAKLEARSRRYHVVLCLFHPLISEGSKSLGCQYASRLLSLLSCLSSFVEHPSSISLDLFWWSSSILQVLGLNLHSDGIMSITCQKGMKTMHKHVTYILIVNPLRTDIHRYKHNLRLKPH